MSCAPERVTGYVDGVLSDDEGARADMEAHLGSCPICREQAAGEEEVRGRLRGLRPVEPRPELVAAVRARARRSRLRPLRYLLPLAAGLALALLWARGAPAVVAWEVAGDHYLCFGPRHLPARVVSKDARQVMDWFERQGTTVPLVPDSVGDLELVGARYCPIGFRLTPHLYYVAGQRHLSLFVIPRNVRSHEAYSAKSRGQSVYIARIDGSTLALVSEHREDVEAFRSALVTATSIAETDTEADTRVASMR